MLKTFDFLGLPSSTGLVKCPMAKKELAVGDQRDGVLHRSENVYQVVLRVTGKLLT